MRHVTHTNYSRTFLTRVTTFYYINTRGNYKYWLKYRVSNRNT